MMASSQLHGHNRGRDSPDWTAEMRDKQARGKDPSKEEELPEPPEMKDSDQENPDQLKIGGRHAEESHLERERKGEAMSVLDNPEALLAYAQASGDSVTGQRLRWLRQLCGYDEDRDRQQIHPRSSKGQQYVGERGSR